MDAPSLQPGLDTTSRQAKTPTTPASGVLLTKKLSSSLSRSNSNSSTASQRARRRQPPRPGHVIRDGMIGSFCPVEVRDAPDGTGKGLFATQDVAKYALLFAEEPLLYAPKGGDRVGNHQARKFLEALDQLSPRRCADFMSLYCSPTQLDAVYSDVPSISERMRNWYAQVKHLSGPALYEAVTAGMRALAIYRTNNVATLAEGEIDSDDSDDSITGGVVYEVFSRINHACDANAAFFFLGVRSHRLGVRALHDIAAGEQLFVSYIGDRSAEEKTLEERRTELEVWGFECGCKACVKEAAEIAKKKEKKKDKSTA
ncbi:SET domain-containing protein [Apiospora arundinis]|uniref:SET domain-containing protein n=1 Tax=Apiospora arundinis TaxID=335852 RepID=A0ABR2IWQ0_9PEZI